MKPMKVLFQFIIALFYFNTLPIYANPTNGIDVAIASNLYQTIKEISQLFTHETGIPVQIHSGASGQLITQALSGASYNIIITADEAIAKKLETDYPHGLKKKIIGHAQWGLWCPALEEKKTLEGLSFYDFLGVCQLNAKKKRPKFILPTPALSPFGNSIAQYLKKYPLDSQWSVFHASTVAQSFNVLLLGNADIGGIASSQMIEKKLSKNAIWLPPKDRSLLPQTCYFLKGSKMPHNGELFFNFLSTAASKKMIKDHGYIIKE
jgi:molybdate transport system substrate-binding protein